MSEKESKFINVLTTILSSFVLAIAIGMFVFYRITIVSTATQDVRIQATEEKVETMRKEWRDDIKEINQKLTNIVIENNKKTNL